MSAAAAATKKEFFVDEEPKNYLVNLVHPGAYATAEEFYENDELALDFCRIFKQRCEQLGEQCFFPHDDLLFGRPPMDQFEKIQDISTHTIVVVTENSYSENETATRKFYNQNVVYNCLLNEKKKYIPVKIGDCSLPWFMKNKVPAKFSKDDWVIEVTMWKKLFEAMKDKEGRKLNVGEKILQQWKRDNIREQIPVNQPNEVSGSPGYTTIPPDWTARSILSTNTNVCVPATKPPSTNATPTGTWNSEVSNTPVEESANNQQPPPPNVPAPTPTRVFIPRYDFKKNEKHVAGGGAVVFLNYKFVETFYNPKGQKGWKREGSHVDVEKYKKLFQEKWKYDFVEREGLSAKDVRTFFLEQNLKSLFNGKQFTRVIVIVSSHGSLDKDGNYVFSVSNKREQKVDEFGVEEFTNMVRINMRKSVIKSGLPIVFLFSTCHGNDTLERDPEVADSIAGGRQLDDPEDTPGSLDDEESDIVTTNHDIPVPKTADLFVGYAQTKGNQAWRSPRSGTRYLRSLRETLKFHTELDLLTAHTIAQHKVGLEGGNDKVQQPALYSTLRKHLFLAPTAQNEE